MLNPRAKLELHVPGSLQSKACCHPSHSVPPVLVLLVSLATGCGGLAEESAMAPELAGEQQQLASDNGLSVNGLSVNGLSSLNFQNWFQSNTSNAAEVMRYVVLCAVPAGQTRTYTDVLAGKTYTWSGSLGLAPGWASGLSATLAEQQLVSGCLAAHVNKYGVHISISVLGKDSAGQPIPYTDSELSSHSRREACLFGNLFSQEGVYAGHDGAALASTESSTRVCTLGAAPGTSQAANCAPLTPVGTCDSYCTLDPTGTYYTSCTYNGTTYQPITTRLQPQDVYQCGDGICQVTETCSANQDNSCQADCGTCP